MSVAWLDDVSDAAAVVLVTGAAHGLGRATVARDNAVLPACEITEGGRADPFPALLSSHLGGAGAATHWGVAWRRRRNADVAGASDHRWGVAAVTPRTRPDVGHR